MINGFEFSSAWNELQSINQQLNWILLIAENPKNAHKIKEIRARYNFESKKLQDFYKKYNINPEDIKNYEQ